MKFLVIFSFLFFAGQSHAYLDPGSFSLLLQSIIAGVLAFIGFFSTSLKIFIKKIKKLFSKK